MIKDLLTYSETLIYVCIYVCARDGGSLAGVTTMKFYSFFDGCEKLIIIWPPGINLSREMGKIKILPS